VPLNANEFLLRDFEGKIHLVNQASNARLWSSQLAQIWRDIIKRLESEAAAGSTSAGRRNSVRMVERGRRKRVSNATTGEVRLVSNAGFNVSAQSTGDFDRPLHTERDLPLPKTLKGATLARQQPESGECPLIGTDLSQVFGEPAEAEVRQRLIEDAARAEQERLELPPGPHAAVPLLAPAAARTFGATGAIYNGAPSATEFH